MNRRAADGDSAKALATFLLAFLFAAVAILAVAQCGCGPAFGTLAVSDAGDASNDVGAVDVHVTIGIDVADEDAETPDAKTQNADEASALDVAAPEKDASRDVAEDACAASKTAALPAYCPAAGASKSPANLIRAFHGGGSLQCYWEPTPAECACSYDCSCILAAFANTPCVWQCMNSGDVIVVYCTGDGPP